MSYKQSIVCRHMAHIRTVCICILYWPAPTVASDKNQEWRRKIAFDLNIFVELYIQYKTWYNMMENIVAIHLNLKYLINSRLFFVRTLKLFHLSTSSRTSSNILCSFPFWSFSFTKFTNGSMSLCVLFFFIAIYSPVVLFGCIVQVLSFFFLCSFFFAGFFPSSVLVSFREHWREFLIYV